MYIEEPIWNGGRIYDISNWCFCGGEKRVQQFFFLYALPMNIGVIFDPVWNLAHSDLCAC
jgi:hypothetical protein